MGFLLTLFFVFLILKLGAVGAVATWSWLWVFSPLIAELVIDAMALAAYWFFIT